MRHLNLCLFALCFFRTASFGRIAYPAFAAAILAWMAVSGMLCHEPVCFAEEQKRLPDFSSLAKEAEFWEKWREEHRDDGRLEPFFYWKRIQEPVDKRLVEIAKRSDPFILVVLTAVNHRIFKVVALAKNNQWQQTKWELEAMEERVVTVPGIEENVLKTLSMGPVFVEANDAAHDVASVFVFIKYQGKQNRLAVYNPHYVFRERAKRDTVADALESLLKDTGVLKWEK